MLASAEAADDAPLPETVQGIIAARLDALAPRGEGAAAGRGRAREGVLDRRARRDDRAPARTSRSALHALERKEFVRRERRSSVAGETEYAFRHALVRDVAYEQIPRAQRAEKHRRAAEWIESLSRPGGPRRDARASLCERARVRARRGTGPGAARRACARGLARSGRPRLRAQRSAPGRGLLQGRARALAFRRPLSRASSLPTTGG